MTLDQKFQLFRQLQQFCPTFFTHQTIALVIQIDLQKVQVNVVTPQELKLVCGESNEINCEQIVNKLFCVQPLKKK